MRMAPQMHGGGVMVSIAGKSPVTPALWVGVQNGTVVGRGGHLLLRVLSPDGLGWAGLGSPDPTGLQTATLMMSCLHEDERIVGAVCRSLGGCMWGVSTHGI